MKKALIVSTNKFPQGDAGAIREEAFARLLLEIGYDVVVVGFGKSTGFKTLSYSGIPYISLRSNRDSIVHRVFDRMFFHKRLNKYVLVGSETYDCILFSSGSQRTIQLLKLYKKKTDCVLVHDSVEWYSPEEFKFGKLSRSYRSKDKLNTLLINKDFRVIAISTFLEKHFKGKGIDTIRVPVILDIASMGYHKKITKETVHFLYAGMPGKKDYLSEIVGAFSKLTNEEQKKCQLTIIGVSKEQLEKDCDVSLEDIKLTENCVKCIGRVSHKEVLNRLAYTDFTVLLRNAGQRYAKAGFPTKFVESLATGTPVVCNYSSDLALYLTDEVNGFVCDGYSSDEMVKCIRRAMSISIEQRQKMQLAARKTAEKYFDYRNYAELLKEFIS